MAALCATAAVGVTGPAAFAAETGNATVSTASSASGLGVGIPVSSVKNGGLVALGDSITFGYNLAPGNLTPSTEAFPYLVGKADDLPVTDLGIPSWTSADLLQAVQTPNFERAIENARVVSIDIGNNDLLHLASQLGLLNEASSSTPITITPAQQQAFETAIAQMGQNL